MTMNAVRRFLRDESGPTAVEYAVMLASIIVIALVGIAALGQQTLFYYERIDTEMVNHGIN